jgi:hypothetical protein
MLNLNSMRRQVIYHSLIKVEMWSDAAGELVLGTAIVEINLTVRFITAAERSKICMSELLNERYLEVLKRIQIT